MTTKTEITQEHAAVEADRQRRVPSDEELLKWAGEEQFFLFCDEDEFLQIAREVLSRYGRGQPKPSNSTELKQPAASAEPAVWVAADTLYSAHPTCISSLAYMSQTDHDRGREYVPLAIINHHAAPVAQEPVAVPWRDVVKAINAVRVEAARRGSMFPQTSEDRADDRKAVHRVVDMIEWYATKGGAVAENLPDWPLYAAPVAAQAQPSGNAGELDERSAFEVWYSEEYFTTPKLKSHAIFRDAVGGYVDVDAHYSWAAWQARAALAQPSAQDREDGK